MLESHVNSAFLSIYGKMVFANKHEMKPKNPVLQQLYIFYVSTYSNANSISSRPSQQQTVSSSDQAESTGRFFAFEMKQGQCLWFQQRPAVHFTDIPNVSALLRESQPGLWWRTHQDAPSRMSQTGSQFHKFMSLKSYLGLSFELQWN